MGTQLIPKETHYGYHHFRSRLEARWAVYLDTLGVLYEYESEGYNLKKGDAYLPDFLIKTGINGGELPYGEFYIEIKPWKQVEDKRFKGYADNQQEAEKIAQAAYVDSDKAERFHEDYNVPIFVVVGTPERHFIVQHADIGLLDKITGHPFMWSYAAKYLPLPARLTYFTFMLFPFQNYVAELDDLTIPLNSEMLKQYPEAHSLLGDELLEYLFRTLFNKHISEPQEMAVRAAMQERFERRD